MGSSQSFVEHVRSRPEFESRLMHFCFSPIRHAIFLRVHGPLITTNFLSTSETSRWLSLKRRKYFDATGTEEEEEGTRRISASELCVPLSSSSSSFSSSFVALLPPFISRCCETLSSWNDREPWTALAQSPPPGPSSSTFAPTDRPPDSASPEAPSEPAAFPSPASSSRRRSRPFSILDRARSAARSYRQRSNTLPLQPPTPTPSAATSIDPGPSYSSSQDTQKTHDVSAAAGSSTSVSEFGSLGSFRRAGSRTRPVGRRTTVEVIPEAEDTVSLTDPGPSSSSLVAVGAQAYTSVTDDEGANLGTPVPSTSGKSRPTRFRRLMARAPHAMTRDTAHIPPTYGQSGAHQPSTSPPNKANLKAWWKQFTAQRGMKKDIPNYPRKGARTVKFLSVA